MHYLNDQIKELYGITEKDYLDWCKKTGKAASYKSTISDFNYRLMTKRLVKDTSGSLIVKKPRKKR